MITKRDMTAALAATALTASIALGVNVYAKAQVSSQPILGPATFDWNDMRVVKTDIGESRPLFEGPTATLDKLEVHITTLNPGLTSHPPHRHLNEELVLIREGTVETLSNGKWVRLGPGSVIFNASNSLHGLRNVGAGPATYFVINWSPNTARYLAPNDK
jgi:XRE family transcriptional regulator, regulator of sulfur utilization